MRKFIVGAALVAAAASPLSAQESVTGAGKPSVFSITPYVGYVFFGDFFEASNGAEYTIDNTGIFGAEATIDIGRSVSLVGNFGYAKSNFEFEFDGTGGGESRTGPDLGFFLYDGSLRLRLPMTMGMSTLSPYVQAGVGAMRYTPDTDDFNGGNATTNVAYNVGVGATFKVMGIGLRGEVKDYITSLDFKNATNSNDFQDLQDATLAHNWAVSLGLTFAF